MPSSPSEDASDTTTEDLLGSSAAGPKALRGGALRGLGYVISIGLSLISVPLLIRHLGIVGFGRYMTVIGIVTIANGLTDAGLANITLREWSTTRGSERTMMMRSLLGIRLELSALGVLVAVGFSAIAGYDHVLVLGTAIAGVGLSMQAICDVLTVALQGELRFGWAAVIDISRQALSVALIVTLVLAGRGVLAFWAVTIPAGLVTVAVAARLVHGRMPLIPRWRDPRWWPLVRAALPYSAALALNTLYFRVTLVVMSLSASAHQTGYFATSFQVTQVLVGVPALAISAAFPILARSASDDTARFARAASRILELAITVGVLLVLGVVLCAPFIVAVIAGAQGHPAVVVLQIQGIALFHRVRAARAAA
jgi:O-antigen/teichoic acid export membrane protein